jgi:two-component system, NarL family, sensor kinase
MRATFDWWRADRQSRMQSSPAGRIDFLGCLPRLPNSRCAGPRLSISGQRSGHYAAQERGGRTAGPSGEFLHLQDEERRKIARDLHDSTGQNLVALATMLGQLSSRVSSAERKSRTLLSECQELADQCIREVRTLSYALYPPELDENGIEDAIRDYVKGFTERSGIQVELEISPRVGQMERNIELALFRVVQESLTNIQRHSGSQQAKIRIDRNSNITLEISDFGRGVLAGIQGRKEDRRFKVGVGILSMQERVKLVGGRLDIDTTAQGTTVRVTVPLGGKEREKAAHSGR